MGLDPTVTLLGLGQMGEVQDRLPHIQIALVEPLARSCG